jgi:4-amino-4-deoxy-L-arabinose transferase-like glycosyltransferase
MNNNSQPTKAILNLHHTFTFLIILGLVIFLGINNITWAIKYIFPLPELFDQAFYLDLSLTYIKAWQNGGLINLLNSVLHSSPYHAPLFPFTTLPFYLIWGMSKNSAYLTSIIYMFIMLMSTYLIGEKFFRPKAGFLSVFMLSTFTVFIERSRDYLLDFPMAAMFTWSMFCLIQAESFQNRKWSMLFGISTGLTLLTKTMAGIYFVGPLLWMVIKSFRVKDRLKNKTINFLLSMGTCTVVAGAYYLPNLKTIFWYLFYFGFGKGSLDYYLAGEGLFSIANLLFYPLATIGIVVSYPFYVLPIIILIILIAGLIKRRVFSGILADKGLLWVWLFSGYLILTLSPNKGAPEYLIAIIPAVVVLVCGLVINIPWKPLKLITLLIIFIGGMINYIALNYGIKGLPNIYYIDDTVLFSQRSLSLGSLNLSNLNIELLPKILNSPDEYLLNLPEKPLTNNNWKINEILENIKKNSDGSIDNLKIAIVPSHFFFNPSNFKYKANILDLKFQIMDLNRQDYKILLALLFDYVITKSGFQGPDFANESNSQISEYLDSPYSGFEKIPWEFVLPDHSKAIVYKRKPSFFISNLNNAIIEKKEKNVTVAPLVFTINNDSRTVLFQHPPSKITYKLTVPDNSSLSFGIALNPEVWSAGKGDGVIFEILAKDGKEERKLFSKYIDPKNKIEDRKWHDEVVDLSRYGGKEVSLSFVTTPGFNHNGDFDWAGWSYPKIVTNNGLVK